MSEVKAYVESKGLKHPKGSDLEALKAQLLKEYGSHPQALQGLTTVQVVTLPLSLIYHNRRHLHALKARVPKGSSRPLVGVVTSQGEGYRLLDGHHRLKWCFAQGQDEGDFILLG